MALVLLVSAIFLVTGAILLKRGAWPRRVGNTPHCPKCDYIISGDQSRCPECGTAVDLNTVVRGERHRRTVMAGIGATLGVFGFIVLMQSESILVNNINWRHYEPLSWLLKTVSNINSPAWAEVQRRLDKNLLSESDLNAVVERGLEVQNMPSTNLAAKNVLDFIGNRYIDGKLTAEQADRFFANLLKVNLAVRRVVGSQSLVPYAVTGFGRGPAWWYRMRLLETQIDDGPVQRNGTSTSSGGGGWGGLSSTGTLASVAKPGKHRLRCKIEMATGTMGGVLGAKWDEDASIVKRVTRELFADFEAVEGQTPIATVASPDAEGLRSLLTVRLAPNPDINPPLKLTLHATLPVDAVFDLFIRFNEKEYGVGTVYVSKGPWGTTLYIGTNMFPANFAASVDVILRSSEARARQTVNISRIWEGEIVYKNVPIDRSSGTKQ